MVIEPIGSKVFKYWLSEDSFTSSHIRTNRFTIGEIQLLLFEGKALQRSEWPSNMWIQWFPTEEKENFLHGKPVEIPGHIGMVLALADPMNPEEIEFVASRWSPTQDDIFGKDYQIIKIPSPEEIKKTNKEQVDRITNNDTK